MASAGRGPQRSRVLRWLERALLVVAIVCLGYYGWVSAETMLYQASENRALDALLSGDASSDASPLEARKPASRPATRSPRSQRVPLAAGTTVGRIEIPRLGVTAVIKAGSDSRTLRLAVGHIPGTALPSQPGNVGLAGHRDTFFRRLKNIRGDDEIRVTTKEGVYRYRVERTNVVQPKDLWVLDPTDAPSLTLVTCYPFSYVGSAPQRFVVRAQLTPTPAN